MKTIKLGYFFPKTLSTYGDNGNIIALSKIAKFNDINLEIVEIEEYYESIISTLDIFFMGGGQDAGQVQVQKILKKYSKELKLRIEDGLPGLVICGGYQLLGKEFITSNGDIIKGMDILPVATKADDKRLIGNISISTELFGEVNGFENHSGQTSFTNNSAIPLGSVISGYGNSECSGKEGIVYRNVIGTYMHGPLLPAAPQISKWLLEIASNKKVKIPKFKYLD